MDEQIERMVVSVRADTQGFARDVAALYGYEAMRVVLDALRTAGRDSSKWAGRYIGAPAAAKGPSVCGHAAMHRADTGRTRPQAGARTGRLERARKRGR